MSYMKQIDFSNRIEVQEYFAEIVNTMQGVKIASVFSVCPSFFNYGPVRKYMEDTEIYILFENEKCLVVEYPFIDALSVNLRSLSEEEMAWHAEAALKDFFNDSTDIYTGTDIDHLYVRGNQTIALEYDSIIGVSLEYLTAPYSKWIDNSLIDDIEPQATTFRTITFRMANGKSFVICPADAIVDGYTLVWSDDAQDTITEY